MAIHSSTLSWKIPWTEEEPDRLQSMGSQRIGHDGATSLSLYLLPVFPGASVVKNPPANAGDARVMGSIPGMGRFPGEGNGNPLQYSCQGNRMNRGAWQAIVHGVTKRQESWNTI